MTGLHLYHFDEIHLPLINSYNSYNLYLLFLSSYNCALYLKSYITFLQSVDESLWNL